MRRRFIVPVAAFNKSIVAHLTFALAGKAPLSPVFGLEAVSLRDARFLHDYKGFVDSCSSGKLVGWAVAEGTAVSVGASINGAPVAADVFQYGAARSRRAPAADRRGLRADAGGAGSRGRRDRRALRQRPSALGFAVQALSAC